MSPVFIVMIILVVILWLNPPDVLSETLPEIFPVKKHTEYDDLIITNSNIYGIPYEWIKAVIYTESSFNPKAYRAEPQINDASRGLMQLLYSTAKSLGYEGSADGLYEPSVNIGLGSKYIRDCFNRTGAGSFDDSSFGAMYSAYNSGKPSRFMTSDQVEKNVFNALAWLDKVKRGVA